MSTQPTPNATPPVDAKFAAALDQLIKSGQQLITIDGCDEIHRAGMAIRVVAQQQKPIRTVVSWNPHRGFAWDQKDVTGAVVKLPFADEKTLKSLENPALALQFIPKIDPKLPDFQAAVFVFENLHKFIDDSVLIRDILQKIVDEQQLTSTAPGRIFRRPIILLNTAGALHPEMRTYAAMLRFPPADERDHAYAIDYVGRSVLGSSQGPPAALREALASSMLGLTRAQAEDVTARCLVATKGWSDAMLPIIEEVKAAQIGQDGFLTYVPPATVATLDDIGGWGGAAAYVRRQCRAYTPAGRAQKLKVPRGIILLGTPGSGKSQFAKMVRQIIYEETNQAFPTYLLNYDALFGGIVGQTEANVRKLLSILAAQRKYILVINEMEKFVGTSGTESDGGTSRKASAKLLDWLSERQTWTEGQADFGYVIGTMNSTHGIAPEFFRRFNATFFVDLPDDPTRLQILQIQLRLNHAPAERVCRPDGKPLRPEDWRELAAGAVDFSGSEIEQAVILSRELAAAARPDSAEAIPTFAELHEAIATTAKSIMARTHEAEIKAMRERCQNIALPVCLPPALAAGTGDRRRGRAIDLTNNN